MRYKANKKHMHFLCVHRVADQQTNFLYGYHVADRQIIDTIALFVCGFLENQTNVDHVYIIKADISVWEAFTTSSIYQVTIYL